MADVPLIVISEFSQSERRITPAWTISQLKSKLETVTGVPPGCQRLSLKRSGAEAIPIEAPNEDDTHMSNYPLVPYAELHVSLSSRVFFSSYFHFMRFGGGLNHGASKISHQVPRRSADPDEIGAAVGIGFRRLAVGAGVCLMRSLVLSHALFSNSAFMYTSNFVAFFLFFPLLLSSSR